ncbi:hypothetical protein [Dinoroseobacter sp. S375]|uniref:hypothetical protein n=1 Tax=Dinoroseobacter sp. S375 TaxID=3415136 RepID=UPI003C7D8D52
MAHVICDIAYALLVMANHISRVAAAMSRRNARCEPTTTSRDRFGAPGNIRNRTFPAHGKSHMQYQSCNIGYANTKNAKTAIQNRKSNITHHASDIRYATSSIIYGKCNMQHQLSLMQHPLWHIPYPKS